MRQVLVWNIFICGGLFRSKILIQSELSPWQFPELLGGATLKNGGKLETLFEMNLLTQFSMYFRISLARHLIKNYFFKTHGLVFSCYKFFIIFKSSSTGAIFSNSEDVATPVWLWYQYKENTDQLQNKMPVLSQFA